MGNITWPAITPGQIVAALSWVLVQLVAMNVVDSQTAATLLQVGSSFVAAFWLAADAVIKHGRNKVLAAHITAGNTKELPQKTLVG